jgi:hypothetical protein
MIKHPNPKNIQSPPPPAHQAMQLFVPELPSVIRSIINKVKKKKGNIDRALTHEEFLPFIQQNGFIERYCLNLAYEGDCHPDDAIQEANLLGHHAYYMFNFELHRRKIFWVEESLAWMFLQTQLDIEGECLKLPFPCCAFLFTDQFTLQLAEKLISEIDNCNIKGELLEILSAYVIEIPSRKDKTILQVNLLFDARKEWPYMLSRELHIKPGDHLETILESHAPDISPDERDDVFTKKDMKAILHLVFNAILYATSAHLDRILIPSPIKDLNQIIARKGPKKRSKLLRKRDEIKSSKAIDDIFYLPGKIDISGTRYDRGPADPLERRTLSNRFMVRGHWRKANPTWKDQRLRWIEPYWKGPEEGFQIEKEYRMKP